MRFLWLLAHPVGNEGGVSGPQARGLAGETSGHSPGVGVGGLGLPDILSAGSQPVCCQKGLPYVDFNSTGMEMKNFVSGPNSLIVWWSCRNGRLKVFRQERA